MRRVFLLFALIGLGLPPNPGTWLVLGGALVFLLETRGPRVLATLLGSWALLALVLRTPSLPAGMALALALSDQLRWLSGSYRGSFTGAWGGGVALALLLPSGLVPGDAVGLFFLGWASCLVGDRLERSGRDGLLEGLMSALGLVAVVAPGVYLSGPAAWVLEGLGVLGLKRTLPRLLPRSPARVLLTTSLAPVRPYRGGHYPLDFFSSRSSRGQGPWSSELDCPYMGTHLLGRNLDASCVSLEYPCEEAFREELREVEYEVVGIGFTVVSRDVIRRMCQIVRELRPEARIVLGGYGVVCLPGQHAGDLGFEGLVDEVCKGEGTRFMRALLGEDPDFDRDLGLPPQRMYPLGLRFLEERFLPIVVGFGCSNRCGFCGTSAFFDGKSLRFAEAETIAETIAEAFARDPAMEMVAIMEEDFLADQERVREVSRQLLSRSDFDYGRLQISAFSTASSIEQYSPEELASLGVSYVWIGVESKFTPLKKRKGEGLEALLRSLEAHGISTTVSWVLGFDFQTPENLQEDVDWLVSLPSVTAQISLLGPLPGTPLWRQLESQGRLLDRPWEDAHLYEECMNYQNFTPGELVTWVDRVYDALYRIRGPSLLRTAEVWIQGYRTHRGSQDPRLQKIAGAAARRLETMSPVLFAFSWLGEERCHRERAQAWIQEARELGLRLGLQEQVLGYLLGSLIWVHGRFLAVLGLPVRQPRPVRVVYPAK